MDLSIIDFFTLDLSIIDRNFLRNKRIYKMFYKQNCCKNKLTYARLKKRRKINLRILQ